jgi:hypothetical protein
MEHVEPELTVLVLDFRKERKTRVCLESVRKYLQCSHKIVYLHNGAGPEYPYELFREGLVDQIIQTRTNGGLAVGTRDLFAASFSPWSFYLQNDQYLTRTFTQEEFDEIKSMFGQTLQNPQNGSLWTVKSVDLAGGMAGLHTYSERAHIIETEFYKQMERTGLNYRGAGPYHAAPWRERQIQDFYREQKFLHYTYAKPLVFDNGDTSVRENPDGSVWEHNVDTNAVRLVTGPVKEPSDYPPFTAAEWSEILKTQAWPKWQVPERRKRV